MMLSEKEEQIVNLLLDKGIEERTIIATIHAMDTEERQDMMITYLISVECLAKDDVMKAIKDIFFQTE